MSEAGVTAAATKRAPTSSSAVTWCWKENHYGMDQHSKDMIEGNPIDCWVKYSHNANDILEAAYQRQWRKGSVAPMEGYTVRFGPMVQVNQLSGYKRNVQRLVKNKTAKEREGRGQCITCGQQTHESRPSSFVPLSIDGQVEKGRCLFCHPPCSSDQDTAVKAMCSGETEFLTYMPDRLKHDRSIALSAVSIQASSLKYLPSMFTDDYEIVTRAVKQQGRALQFASQRLQGNEEVVLSAIPENTRFEHALQYATMTLRNDPTFMKRAVQKNPWALAQASKDCQDDKDIVLLAVSQNGGTLAFASQRCQSDPEILGAAAKVEIPDNEKSKDGAPFKQSIVTLLTADPEKTRLKDNKEHILDQVSKEGRYLNFASDRLRDDKYIVLAAVSNDPDALAFASANIQDDEEVVIKALKVNGDTLRFASERLRQEKRIILAAIEGNNTNALVWAPANLRGDKEVVLAAVQKNVSALFLASKDLQDDHDVFLAAVSNSGMSLQYCSKRLQNEKEIVLTALKQDGESLQYASDELRQEKDCVMAALSSRPTSLKYALGGLNQDRECLIAAGLLDPLHGKREASRRIVLSTRFSLDEKSSPTATQFTLQLKEHPYIQDIENNFTIYSPNAFGKNTCDPDWTNFEWPCRGTKDTCQQDSSLFQLQTPTDACCWRYSYRYQLEQARQSRGFMLQVVEFDGGEHKLGKGQEIEVTMADEVGTKVFRVNEPFLSLGTTSGTSWKRPFLPSDIDNLIQEIQEWYADGCLHGEERTNDAADEVSNQREESKTYVK